MQALEADDPPQLGGYKLLARLGAGGMGRVYLARSRGGRRVALKVIRPELADDPDFRARFAREVSSARAVGGAFTVAVLDADPEAATPWLATEYVAGPALSTAVREHGPLPVASVRALAAGLAEALEAIHAAGVIHRDLKPSNVLLAGDGPRVIDFGISRAAEATELTRTGVIVGSPGFMSPEQIEGRPVTPATDVFSLGAVLAYAATGAGPFGEGATPALLYRVVHSEPMLESLPGELHWLVSSCLAKDAAVRPTPSAVLDRLEAEEAAGADSHAPTEMWLPAELTGMIARVEAERPSLLDAPRSSSAERAGAERAGAQAGAAAGAGAVGAAAFGAGGTGGTGTGGAGADGAGAGAFGADGTGGSTAPTVPQPRVDATPPQGFGPPPAAFGAEGAPTPPAGFGAEGATPAGGFGAQGTPTPPQGYAGAHSPTRGYGVPAGFGAEGAPTPPPRSAAPRPAAGPRRRWPALLATAVVAALVAAGIVFALNQPKQGTASGGSGGPSVGVTTTPSSGASASTGSPSTPPSSPASTAAAGNSGSGGGGRTYLTVPDVTGQPVDYAKQLLANAGFSSKNVRVTYHCTSAGTGVYLQSPSAGNQAYADAVIRLTASENDCVAYTNEVGQPLATAQNDLKGFSNIAVVQVCQGGTVGNVVAQSPAPGAEASYPPSTPITLKVQQDGCASAGSSSSPPYSSQPSATP